MAETATLDAPPPSTTPVATPAAVTPQKAASRAAQVQIQVTPPSAIDPGPDAALNKPKGAMAEARAALNKRARSPLQGLEEATPTKPPVSEKPAAGEKPGETVPPAGETEQAEDGTKPAADGTKPAEPAKPDIDPRTGKPKVNPWRMVDDYKAKLATAEAKLAEYTKATPKLDETLAEVKKTQERIAQVESRNKQLEEAIRFKDYEQSTEFAEKYNAPYDRAWNSALGELKELTVSEGGADRPFNAQDMLTLVNLPLKEAHALAIEQYGDLASEVMAHRKQIKNLFEQRQTALTEARKTGAERDKQAQAKTQEQRQQIQKEIQQFADEATEKSVKHEKYGKFFSPQEGDEDGNARLSKGFELVDKAFSAEPNDPRLTPEQRANIVRQRAAVRFRAAAFGKLSAMVEKLQATLAEKEAELKSLSESEPPAGGRGGPASPNGQPASAMERAKEELRKRAR